MDEVLLAGSGGPSGAGQPGVAGQPQAGPGFIAQYPGSSRRLSATVAAANNAPWQVTVTGQPGDSVWLVGSGRPGWDSSLNPVGLWSFPYPQHMPVNPKGVIPGSGTLTLQVPFQTAPGELTRAWFVQAYILDSQGGAHISSPLQVLVLDCAALLPDCNGNGSFDSCDLLTGSSVDCDLNGRPDECDADCNANLVADACDIASGTSTDLNSNGIPDECDPSLATWHVDASAPAGGDGSPGSPFRDISEGIAIGLPGDTILVADGTYTGPANRDMNFGGRDMVVQSVNGPASCIIDLQNAGRAFELNSGESSAAAIIGLTIRNGQSFEGGAIRAFASNPLIEDCVFENNSSGNAKGGAVRFFPGFGTEVFVRDCVFTGNSGGDGGALSINGKGRVEGCIFDGNTANNVGGGMVIATVDTVVSHCVFTGNTAGNRGGAVYFSGFASDQVLLDDCLVAGNFAPRGGGVAGNGNLLMTNMTIVDNSATFEGGGIRRDHSGLGSIANSVVWNNTAASGAQIALIDSGASGSTLSVYFSDVQGGVGAAHVDPNSTLNWVAGNLDADPLFVDADGPDNDPLTLGDNDWRLGAGSPCIDAAANSSVAMDLLDLDGDMDTTEPVPFDLDGAARFRGRPGRAGHGDGDGADRRHGRLGTPLIVFPDPTGPAPLPQRWGAEPGPQPPPSREFSHDPFGLHGVEADPGSLQSTPWERGAQGRRRVPWRSGWRSDGRRRRAGRSTTTTPQTGPSRRRRWRGRIATTPTSRSSGASAGSRPWSTTPSNGTTT